MKQKPVYTCNEYRQEMVLLGLKNRLTVPDLSEDERKSLEEEIQKIEDEMGL